MKPEKSTPISIKYKVELRPRDVILTDYNKESHSIKKVNKKWKKKDDKS